MTQSPGSQDEGTGARRGRRPVRPDPGSGPVALLAHRLWELKEQAGDPSFADMASRLGAAASKSSLAAAARGSTLPSWETTWEFVRVLAVDRLGRDADEVRREWRAYWEEAAHGGPAARRENTTRDDTRRDDTHMSTSGAPGAGASPPPPGDDRPSPENAHPYGDRASTEEDPLRPVAADPVAAGGPPSWPRSARWPARQPSSSAGSSRTSRTTRRASPPPAPPRRSACRSPRRSPRTTTRSSSRT
ncbi:hypothetical protein ACFQ0B_68545 [Nonomuraea thailandensis]